MQGRGNTCSRVARHRLGLALIQHGQLTTVAPVLDHSWLHSNTTSCTCTAVLHVSCNSKSRLSHQLCTTRLNLPPPLHLAASHTYMRLDAGYQSRPHPRIYPFRPHHSSAGTQARARLLVALPPALPGDPRSPPRGGAPDPTDPTVGRGAGPSRPAPGGASPSGDPPCPLAGVSALSPGVLSYPPGSTWEPTWQPVRPRLLPMWSS